MRAGPAAFPALPAAFEARMRRLLGAEADELLASLGRPPVPGLRVHPGRMDLARLEALTGWRLDPLPWDPHAAALDAGSERPGLHPLHEAGAFYLQEPSATAPAVAMAVRPGERVLDLAAAPGGKATALAGAVGDDGLLVANDVHPQRVQALGRNLERMGARRTIMTQEEPARLAARWPGAFDAVLVDAPCSGEGMFRKSPEARRDWSEDTVRACAARQGPILDAAADLVAPGGRLVYSTCTFAPEENEGAVAELLARRPELRPDPFELPGLDGGRPEWACGPARSAAEGLAGATARAWPHRVAGEGHFVARLRRDGAPASGAADAGTRRGGPGSRGPRSRGPGSDGRGSHGPGSHGPGEPAPAEARTAWRAFRSGALAPRALDRTDGEPLTLRGETLWWPTKGVDARGLRVLRDGLALGRWRKGRFEPSHALAQSLRRDEVGARLELTPEDPALAAYLAGHELDTGAAPSLASAEDGTAWVLVTVHGAPLGWLRRSGTRLRNLYPRGLRRG